VHPDKELSASLFPSPQACNFLHDETQLRVERQTRLAALPPCPLSEFRPEALRPILSDGVALFQTSTPCIVIAAHCAPNSDA
jgi:hypothetical protein